MRLDGTPLSPQSKVMSENFQNRLTAVAQAIEGALDRLLSSAPRPAEIARPEPLLSAMRHAALGGGKRIRPFLLVESAGLFGTDGEAVTQTAAALECVHCYSLVHDDLPAMDDDDLRRGQPTVHKAFDEATAILAGDGLLTLAFEILADIDAGANIKIELITGMARAAGLGGMVGGQMLDLTAENTAQSEQAVLRLQSMKTGALIAYACEAGAILGHASETERQSLLGYGKCLGRAFQLADDLIDATGESDLAGKATGKDADRGKATLVAIYGISAARARLNETIEEANELLAPFGARADILAECARFIASRKN